MHYVDGFVLPVPKKNLAAYRRMAAKAGKVWMEYGALAYVECVADDVQAGQAHLVPAERQAQARRDRGVLVHRLQVARASATAINKQVMADPRIAGHGPARTMPFDGKRMFWGGFKGIVEL